MAKRITIFITLIGLLLISLVALLIVIYISFGQPVPTALIEATVPQGNTAVPDQTRAAVHTTTATAAPLQISTPTAHQPQSLTVTPTSQPEPRPSRTLTTQPDQVAEVSCEPQRSMDLLLLIEASETDPRNGIQAVRYIRATFDDPGLMILGFPAGLRLSTPSLARMYGITESSLSDVYQVVYEQSGTQPNPAEIASNAVGLALYDGFRLAPEHFLTINQAFLEGLLLLAGPLEVENAQAFSANGREYPQGTIQIGANQVWDYITYAGSPSEEYARLARQDAVLTDLLQSLRSSVTLVDLAAWFQSQKDQLVSDLEPGVMEQSLCVVYAAAPAQFQIDIIPQEFTEVHQTGLVLQNHQAAEEYARGLLSSRP